MKKPCLSRPFKRLGCLSFRLQPKLPICIRQRCQCISVSVNRRIGLRDYNSSLNVGGLFKTGEEEGTGRKDQWLACNILNVVRVGKSPTNQYIASIAPTVVDFSALFQTCPGVCWFISRIQQSNFDVVSALLRAASWWKQDKQLLRGLGDGIGCLETRRRCRVLSSIGTASGLLKHNITCQLAGGCQ